jgi:peptidyl-dipeptidase A
MRRCTFLLLVLMIPILSPAQTSPTVADAEAFMKHTEQKLNELTILAARAAWVQATYITDDTEILAADRNEKLIAATTELVEQSKRFDGLALPPELARKFKLLRLSLTLPAPTDPVQRAELTRIAASLEADYGKGKYCPKQAIPDVSDKCLDLTAIEKIMATNHDPKVARELWVGWHEIAPPLRERYARLVTLSNIGARELGFKNVGYMWRSNYDMTPEQFTQEYGRLWEQVRPLYEALHAYVRRRLAEHYGASLVPPDGMIPADLLGNMWAQSWEHIYPLVAPPDAQKTYDLTELLQAKKVEPLGMVHYGENFFTSLGFASLPQTFWERSLFVKPRDREVVCHASAWDIDNQDDLRLKMCIQVRDEDFVVVHHELGHNFYQRAYKHQPFLFENGANDGFHEAVGDTIALSITPEYLHEVGLLPQVPAVTEQNDINYLLKEALEKVAFLPFGLLIDEWRWKVFSGEVTPTNYNQAWWKLRNQYQGVAAPVPRSEADFDPGAKYHVDSNTPYARYFLADILEFQFYRAMCRTVGYTGPLHRCSFYKSKAAGAKLNKMLEMGQSQPWPVALETLTGQKDIDASAILEYFAPLKKWLDEQNRGHKVGW